MCNVYFFLFFIPIDVRDEDEWVEGHIKNALHAESDIWMSDDFVDKFIDTHIIKSNSTLKYEKIVFHWYVCIRNYYYTIC